MTKTIIQRTSAVVLIGALAVSAVVTWNTGTVQAQSNIIDGDLVKTADNPDVYIVKLINGKRFVRLILNPAIFDSYGHLHWDNIKTITPAELSAYTTSNLVREVRANGEPFERVYALYPDSTDDTGVKRRVISLEIVDYDADAVYSINHKEASGGFYVNAAPVLLTAQTPFVPVNERVKVERLSGKIHNIRVYDIYEQLVAHEQYSAYGLLLDAKYYKPNGALRWIRYYRTDRTLERIAYYSPDGTRIVRNDYYNEHGTEVVRSIGT